MKNRRLILIFVSVTMNFTSGFAQLAGIHFDVESSWSSIKAKAKVEDKYIFVDCYTTWCGPCKYMSESIFSAKEVGDLFNKKFISIKVQMDTTEKDNDTIRSWYFDAHKMQVQNEVIMYPTYLFFSPDGKVIHKFTGASAKPGEFIEKVKEALEPRSQYYTLVEQYDKGNRDSDLLETLALQTRAVGNDSLARVVGNEYFRIIKKPFISNNLSFIGKITTSTKDKGFDLYLRHTSEVDEIMGKYYAERKVMNVIMSEDSEIVAVNARSTQGLTKLLLNGQEIYTKDAQNNIPEPLPPDWNDIYKNIKVKYGGYYATRIVKWLKIHYYNRREKWTEYTRSLVDYVRCYQDDIKIEELNGYAWDIFTYSNDKGELKMALLWSRRTLSGDHIVDYTYMDTYANILYKLGKYKKAIFWEKKALHYASENDKEVYEENLKKMQRK